MASTPAIRAAEEAGIGFRLHEYEHDRAADNLGLEAAARLDLAPERVFKTLVAQLDGGALLLAIVPVDARLDLKRLAEVAGGKKADLADPAAAERATGYVVGGISPLGGRRRLPAVLDASALAHETLFVSAGRRGCQMELSPHDLVRLSEATVAAIARRG